MIGDRFRVRYTIESIVTIVGLYLPKIFSYTHEKRVRHHESRVKNMPWGGCKPIKATLRVKRLNEAIFDQSHLMFNDTCDKKLINWPDNIPNMVAKTYGFYARKGMESVLWIMGYGMHFPANQLGELKKVWGVREYGLSRLWITVDCTHSSFQKPWFFFASVHQLYMLRYQPGKPLPRSSQSQSQQMLSLTFQHINNPFLLDKKRFGCARPYSTPNWDGFPWYLDILIRDRCKKRLDMTRFSDRSKIGGKLSLRHLNRCFSRALVCFGAPRTNEHACCTLHERWKREVESVEW